MIGLCLGADPAAAGEGVALEPIVVTGTRPAQSGGEYGGNITVIGPREIASSGASDLAGLLASVPGVFMTKKGNSRSAITDIRGFGDTADRNVVILIDGRRLNSADNAAVDLSMVPLEAIDRVEVMRGAGSVFYGDNAVGGVVNIITKKGRGPAETAVTATAGSYGARSAGMSTGGGEAAWSYFLFSEYADRAGYRANSDVLSANGGVRLGHVVSKRLSLDADMIWHEDDYGLPGGLNDAGLASLGRRGSDEEENNGQTRDRTMGLALTARPWEDPSVDGTVTAEYFFRNQDSYGWYDYGSWGAHATKRAIDTHGVLVKYAHRGEVAGRAYTAVIGTDLYAVTNDILGSGEGLSASSDDLTITKDEIGLYAYTELEAVSRVFVGVGGRRQSARYAFDQRSGTPAQTTREPSETVGKWLIRYEYAERSNLYVSAEETFRFLSTDEWYSTWTGLDTTLAHQRGVQYELGWRHDIEGMAQVSVVPYWIDLEDEIFLDPSVSPGHNANYDETRRRGIEVSGSWDLLRCVSAPGLSEWRVAADYRYQEAEFTEGNFSGRDVPMAPRHQAGIRMNGRARSGLGLSVGERLTGARYVINDIANALPQEEAYWVTDVETSFKKEEWEVWLRLENLFARRYHEMAVKSAGDSMNVEYYPAPGRAVVVGAKWVF